MSTERKEIGIPGDSAQGTLLKGAALLGGAALLSKLIGTLQKIPLQNVAGDEVFGLYSAVYALAVMWITLAAAGVPTAVSVLVAERSADGEDEDAQRVLRWSIVLLGLSGLIAFGLAQAFADTLAAWMGAKDAASAIRTSSIALLFAPATAAMRGFRQGQMKMLRPAVSQIVEQSARVAFMLVMLVWAIEAGWSPSSTAASLHGGLAAGASAGLAAMLWPARKRREPIALTVAARGARKKYGSSGATAVESTSADPVEEPTANAAKSASSSGSAPAAGFARPKKVRMPETRLALVKRIAVVAIPVAIASVAAPLLGLIDAFSVPRLLQHDPQVTSSSAMASFGVYNRGVALLQLILMAASGAAAALVPALTAARARGEGGGEEAAMRAAFTIRLAWWIGCAAAIGLALLASPVNIALFSDNSGSAALAIIAFAAVGGTLQAVSGGLLQGLGELRAPAVNLAAAAILKLTLNALLVPAYGINGAAAAMTLAFAAAALLNALSLRQRIAIPAPRAATMWRPAAALTAMAALTALAAALIAALARALPDRAAALLTALPGVAVGAAAFAASLVAFGALSPQQWRALPGLSAGSRPDRAFTRLFGASIRIHRSAEAEQPWKG
ncbi:polysaccharide biosynthesis C-terminal domain-containing protein [Cohnella faecalis]|uniref:Polysaccharide biosynthesis protein n=1 Tax=Cohnella faecalis TaxID=2315694 RepID=A0A398CHC2_9BACL|nr:polysaccharide biosynthesis C-terminal domain-containing protein [Cohnella faecalis]RIE01372.1 polysaccharide biosynthesis protein [Cohnella faecalis]